MVGPLTLLCLPPPQLRSTAQVAADQLRYLVFHRDHDREVLANPGLMAHLLQQVCDVTEETASASFQGITECTLSSTLTFADTPGP